MSANYSESPGALRFSSIVANFSEAPLASVLGNRALEMPSAVSLLVGLVGALLAVALAEQIKFRWSRIGKAGSLPGPGLVVPFLGGIVDMVKDPHRFWEIQRAYSEPGLSWNSIVGMFTVVVTDPAIARHVFTQNSPNTLMMELHPNAKMVLGLRNIAFMHGPEHKALRKSFLALFTRRALSTYVQKQDVVIRDHLKQWMEKGAGPRELRMDVRDMNAYTSQEVFVGPYLDDPKVRAKFSSAYRDMTDAFLALPLKFPGTAVWRGYKGRLYIIKVLTEAAARSKARMAQGHEPDCLLDFWSQQILKECQEAEAANQPPPKYSCLEDMAFTVMDFLFASQDASTASLVWTLTLMAEHPDVLERVREEQRRVRPDPNVLVTGEMLQEMNYTRQVVREILRYRPPAPMVPQIAKAPFKLSETYTAPKGALIIPDIISPARQGYSNPHDFDPDRFSPERKEDVTYAGNFLVFGHGPHYCVGKDYAMNHLMVFLAIMATSVEWTRTRTKDSDYIKYLPTIYPFDSIFTMSWRAGQQPSH